jgi:hypothetical protein
MRWTNNDIVYTRKQRQKLVREPDSHRDVSPSKSSPFHPLASFDGQLKEALRLNCELYEDFLFARLTHYRDSMMSRISYSDLKELWSRRDVTPRSRTVTDRMGRSLHPMQDESHQHSAKAPYTARR